MLSASDPLETLGQELCWEGMAPLVSMLWAGFSLCLQGREWQQAGELCALGHPGFLHTNAVTAAQLLPCHSPSQPLCTFSSARNTPGKRDLGMAGVNCPESIPASLLGTDPGKPGTETAALAQAAPQGTAEELEGAGRAARAPGARQSPAEPRRARQSPARRRPERGALQGSEACQGFYPAIQAVIPEEPSQEALTRSR